MEEVAQHSSEASHQRGARKLQTSMRLGVPRPAPQTEAWAEQALEEWQARSVGELATRLKARQYAHVGLRIPGGRVGSAEVLVQEVQREAKVRDHAAPPLDAVFVAQPVSARAQGAVPVKAVRLKSLRRERAGRLASSPQPTSRMGSRSPPGVRPRTRSWSAGEYCAQGVSRRRAPNVQESREASVS